LLVAWIPAHDVAGGAGRDREARPARE